jgi:CBS domain-containing protein
LQQSAQTPLSGGSEHEGATKQEMEVREGMSNIVLTLGPGHTLREAARQMSEKGVGAAVVLDEEQPGPGIISERDVLVSIGHGQDPDSERVGDHMNHQLITATPAWSLERAATEMAHRGIRHLVVVEGADLVGVLSMRDIMNVWTSDGATSAMTPG